MAVIPKSISILINKRAKLRARGDYRRADALRKKIEKLGYSVVDKRSKTNVIPIGREKMKEISGSFLVLFGSGEISSMGRQAHEYVLGKLNKNKVTIVIVTTPAGFQPNVKVVHEEIREFFATHLKNFHPHIEILYANDRLAANNDDLIVPVKKADYIFLGPGSPTYAVKHLKDTLLLQTVKNRLQQGVSLCLSSAAVLAFSRYTLPVYEIYKVGTLLYWEKGLDFYSDIMQYTTVIPHLNNREGGDKTDTSYCFMGKERFTKLLTLLPQKEKVIGIDEQTAVIIELSAKKEIVLGKGNIHTLSAHT